MTDKEGGARVKRLVLAAMGARRIPSIVQLSERADVGRDTLNAWFRGREPGPGAGAKVAEALGISYRDIMDAYRGTPQATQTPDELVSALRAHVVSMDALTEAIRSLLPVGQPRMTAQETARIHEAQREAERATTRPPAARRHQAKA